MPKNISHLSGRKGLTDNLFEKLSESAVNDGTPDKEALEEIAREFLIGSSSTYGTTTFYDFLKPGNKGKKVYICNGSVCTCAGTQDELKSQLLNHFAEDEIGEMCCLGRCHENAAFHFDGKNYSAKSEKDLQAIIDQGGNNWDNYMVQSSGKGLLTEPIDSFDDHYKLLGDILRKGQDDALSVVKSSGVRGRGGAGFPMHLKLGFCMKAESDLKFIICNADEGDPGAFSDRYLLEQRPHHVLFGMMVAGYIIGAKWGILYIRGEYPESVEIIEQAVDQLHSQNLLGENIMGSDFEFNFKVIKAQGSYICGEETALINSIEGQRPEIRVRPPYPAQVGLFQKPTIVNNVETLAALYPIFKYGGEEYGALGTGKSFGTKLLSLDSAFAKPGICEVEMGTSLSDVVYNMGGGFVKPVKALHIGGPLGGLVPVSEIEKLNVDFESFSANGFLLGHASIISIPESMPMIQYLEHLMEFAAHESCGKCFPCRLGTKRAQEMLDKAMHEDYTIDRQLFDDLLHTLEIGSLCAHGGGIPLPVRNALMYFDDELKAYFN